MSQLAPDQQLKLSAARDLASIELVGRQGESLLIYYGGQTPETVKVYVRQTGTSDVPPNILNRVKNFITSNTGYEVVFEPRPLRSSV